MPLLGTPADRAARWRARSMVALLLVIALGVGVGGSIVSAQEGERTQPTLPTTTEAGPSTTVDEPTTTTEAEPTTTTEAEEQTTTSVRRTTTTVDDLEDPGAEDEPVEDEVTTTTGETTTTIRDLLVPGDGSEGSESTTTTTAAPPEQASSTTSGMSEETMIWLIVAGLVAIALFIGLWTWRYWRATRPERPAATADPTTVFPGE